MTWTSNVMSILAIIWIGIFPFINGGSYSNITRVKWLAMLVLCALTVTTILCITLILMCQGKIKAHIRINAIHVVALVYFSLLVISFFVGPLSSMLNRQNEMIGWIGAVRYEGLLTQLVYAIIFIMMSTYSFRTDWLACGASVSLMLFVLVVALQYMGYNPFWLFSQQQSTLTNYEFQGTIGNIDMVSGWLSLVVPLVLGYYVVNVSKQSWMLFFGGLSGVLLLWMIEVQSGIIALICGCIMLAVGMLCHPTIRSRGFKVLAGIMLCLLARRITMLPWLDNVQTLHFFFDFDWINILILFVAFSMLRLARFYQKRCGKSISYQKTIASVLLFLMIAMCVLLLLPIPKSENGLWEAKEVLLGRGKDSFGSWRWGVWRCTLDMCRSHLLFGTGPDTFYEAMQVYLQQTNTYLGENFENPHNLYLAILSNNGIFAIGAYVVLVGLIVVSCVRHKKGIPLAISIVCYSVQGFFSFSVCLVSPIFFAIMGLAASVIDLKKCPVIKASHSLIRRGNCS